MKNIINVVFSSHLGKIYSDKLKNQISNTIGCKHNVYAYENNNEFSLAEIYNKSLLEHQTKNSIFVFIHNDIIFKTKNWGRILLDRFNNNNYSIIGVAGTGKLNDDGIWWGDKSKLFGIVNHTDGTKEWESSFSRPFNGIKDVVTIDGVFISVDPDNIEYKFDEEFGKYHFYDISFCIPNYLAGCNIGVTTDIRIIHKSIGEVNNDWENNRIKFIEKYKDEFPINVNIEIQNIQEFNIKLTIEPKVSVIIPTKNNLKYLIPNIESWKEHVKYSNYEIIIADTGSNIETLDGYNKIIAENENIKLIKYNYFNFAKINNDVVKNSCRDSELILFCNDDIKLLNDCLSRVVEVYLENKNVGTVGIRLHYADNSVQHNGILLGRKNNNEILITHLDLGKIDFYNTSGYFNSAGNTGAFLLINKNLFNEFNGFNENYIECFEDVELNLECVSKGNKNITVFDAVAYHYESISRNNSPEKNDNSHIDYKKLIKYMTDENR